MVGCCSCLYCCCYSWCSCGHFDFIHWQQEKQVKELVSLTPSVLVPFVVIIVCFCDWPVNGAAAAGMDGDGQGRVKKTKEASKTRYFTIVSSVVVFIINSVLGGSVNCLYTSILLMASQQLLFGAINNTRFLAWLLGYIIPWSFGSSCSGWFSVVVLNFVAT